VVRSVIRDEGFGAFYKGLIPSCVGIAPYSSINFAAFDLLKKALPEDLAGNSSAIFLCSFAAAALATGGCYPLDTIRRQMQMKSSAHANVLAAAAAIVARDGVRGLYRGFLPNAAKNLPNSSIRLSSFDAAKKLLAFSRKEMAAEVEACAAKPAAKKGGKR
jgi:solute carrier family 25 phosphate transporter 23/24/25/41